MSVCIAWQYDGKICLAADSRFVGGDIPLDFGIKVLECPIEIISAIDNATGNYDVWHRSSVGIAFSGSQLAGYLVKERIAEIFLKLQYVGPRESLTFEKIANAAFKVFAHAVTKLNQAYGGFGHQTDFFLVGKCPSEGRPIAYKFSVDDHSEEPVATRVLGGAGFTYEAIGAGADRLRERIEARLAKGRCMVHFMVLEELREMIIRDEVASVGGALQYGEISGHGAFEIHGVLDFRFNGLEPITMPASRGIDLEDLLHPQNPDDLYLRDTAIAPFQHILDDHIKNNLPRSIRVDSEHRS